MNEDRNNNTLPSADVEQTISDELEGEKEGKGPDTRVNVTVTSYRRAKHDPDGVSCKAVLDGIVRAGLLSDDSTEEIKEVSFKSIKCKTLSEEQTIIEITPANQ